MATMLPIGLELPGEPSVPEMMATASLAEQLGYESIWLTETRFTRDAVTTTSAVATATHIGANRHRRHQSLHARRRADGCHGRHLG